ncbi:MAG TPA: hypothetical protein VJ521_12035, partial [Acidobacteriota bacterium]|nr:hypothetical protein [Acidobacteriota bacterium]
MQPVPRYLIEKALKIPRKSSQAGTRRGLSFFPLAAAAVLVAIALAAFLYLRARVIPEPSRIADLETSQGTAAYWLEKYGALSPAETPWAIRAGKVFHRMTLVADQRKKIKLRLILIGGEATPYAIALRDGSIVLSANALRVCYQHVPPEEGDARLAFVLGHELVHQKYADFLHAAAFAALERQEAIPQSSAEAEQKADSYGLVYATMAGYDPRSVLKEGSDFLQSWASQTPQQAAYKETTHPEPGERADLLRSHLKSVADDLDYFHFGVRLYQIGRYDDAILFLQRFAEKFPAREVFNNLGLCRYQLAMQTLASCDPALVQQFYAATFLDTETLVGRLRTPAKTACLQNEDFRKQMQMAQHYFQSAVEMDPVYVPARVNGSSLHMILGEYDLARNALKEALILKPEEPAALNNQALLIDLSGEGNGNSSLSILQDIL